MKILNFREPISLFVLDLIVLCTSLWITLLIRHFEIPSYDLLSMHIFAFGTVFFIWIVVFYIAGLYDKHTSILRNNVHSILLNAHIISAFISLALFYFLVPVFILTPKTVLIIFVFVSFILFYGMRVFAYPKISLFKKQNALLIGSGVEVEQVFYEINSNAYYPLYFVEMIDLQKIEVEEFKNKCTLYVTEKSVFIIVGDLKQIQDEYILSFFYQLILKKVHFIEIREMYENVFQKIPLTLINYEWFVEHISNSKKIIYDSLKRSVDIGISIIGLCISSVISFFVILAIKIEEPFGKIFISQKRIGKNGLPITIYKFRTMKRNENGVWIGESDNVVTRVGKFLRKSSIDELPQFWNILKGDISLVGPRPDMTGLEDRLSREISYYNARYVVKPGLSGWAQTHQNIIPNNIEENKERLAYDLFYIKNRSLFLDIKIILKTLKILFVRGTR